MLWSLCGAAQAQSTTDQLRELVVTGATGPAAYAGANATW
jgi:hypothetical protein